MFRLEWWEGLCVGVDSPDGRLVGRHDQGWLVYQTLWRARIRRLGLGGRSGGNGPVVGEEGVDSECNISGAEEASECISRKMLAGLAVGTDDRNRFDGLLRQPTGLTSVGHHGLRQSRAVCHNGPVVDERVAGVLDEVQIQRHTHA
jgi:hypothetical protein